MMGLASLLRRADSWLKVEISSLVHVPSVLF